MKGGRTVTRSLGKVGVVRLKDALQDFQQLAALCARGDNPNEAARVETERLRRERLSMKNRCLLELFDEWREAAAAQGIHSPATQVTVADMRRFFLKLQGQTFSSLTDTDLKQWLRHTKHSHTATEKCIKYLNAIHSILPHDEKPSVESPAVAAARVGLKQPKNTKKSDYLATAEDFQVFWLAFLEVSWRREQTPHVTDDVALDATLLILLTGERLSACLNLRAENVHKERQELHFPMVKGGKGRFIPITSTLALLLEKRLQECARLGTPWLFPSRKKPECPIGNIRKVTEANDEIVMGAAEGDGRSSPRQAPMRCGELLLTSLRS